MKWIKSSYSSGQGNCVEAGTLPDGGVAVRDSKDHGAGPVLGFTRAEWDAFRAGMGDGEFDDV
jgi:hypothetical protein